MTKRVLLGMLTPSSNTVLEPVTAAMISGLPEVSAHFGRFRVTEIALSPQALGQYRRIAVFMSVLISAIVTPGGDPFSLMLLAAPIYLLYELGIFMAGFVTARSRNPEAATGAAAAVEALKALLGLPYLERVALPRT